MPPPPNIPPPPVPQLEPLYAYPSSIYGTLPRGPPRPLERPGLPTIFQVHHPQSEFTNSPNHQSEEHIQDSDEDESAIENAKRQKQRLAVINYATFRQNISAEAAAAALRRAEITAHMARYWSDEDLSGQMPTMRMEDNNNMEASMEASSMASAGSGVSAGSSGSTGSQSTDEVVVHRRTASPSPSASRRSRSTSPGKTVTFGPSLEQDERSLYELDESPRRKIHLKPLALAASNLIAVSKGQNSKAKTQESPKGKAKRRAPSPPPSDHEDFQRGLSPRGPPPPPTSKPPVPQPHSLDGLPHGALVSLVAGDSLDYVEGHQLSEAGLTLDLEDFSSEGEEEVEERELGSGHEALGAKLSASLRQTFHLKRS